MALLRNVGITLEMIKWEHSVFALPFALSGAMLAAAGLPAWSKVFWIVVCMVTARSAAMAFNRWADAALDAANPRTAVRAIPSGLLSRNFVAGFTIFMSLAFILAASQLNRTTLLLSPVALAIVLLYSYTKRFTRWSHLVLGLALGIAPAAAWIAIRGTLDPRIVVLTLAVLFWVGGFADLGSTGRVLDRTRHAPDHAGSIVLAAEAFRAKRNRLGWSSRRSPSTLVRAPDHLAKRP
jgi:4-hydroxybenzoate polyprenyltransferase